MTTSLVHGLLAEFDNTNELVRAAQSLYERGYRRMDAHTPFPVEGLAEALGFTRTRLPLVVLIGAIVGGTLGFALQYWASIIAYPLNVGGRPISIATWPSFVPVTFELTILGGAVGGVGHVGAEWAASAPPSPLCRRKLSHGRGVLSFHRGPR